MNHRTLPSALRSNRDPNNEAKKRSSGGGPTSSSSAEPSQLFGGLNLNLGISNLISGGMNNLLGHFRRNKTPNSSSASTPIHPANLTSITSSSSASVVPLSTRSSSVVSSEDSSTNEVFYEPYEQIELCSFPVLPEAAGDGQTGEGHSFHTLGSYNPTWCDLCGDLIWGLYNSGVSRCGNCDYTCHEKCQKRVRLNCSSLSSNNNRKIEEEEEMIQRASHNDDEETLADISTLKEEEIHEQNNEEDCMTLKGIEPLQLDSQHQDNPNGSLITDLHLDCESLFGDKLADVIKAYNSTSPPGQETVLEEGSGGVCRGFIRVQLSLRRPINVISGTRPPSIYNITKEDTVNDSKTLTSFYLPADTEKSLHVTSNTTTRDVIRSLLYKFSVADTPHKYALYDKTLQSSVLDDASGSTLSRVSMRKMRDEERPLVLALTWCNDQILSEKCFVLQENDPGEVSWESFSIPELKNFLLILDREEAWYKKKIHDKYECARSMMQDLVNEKKPSHVEGKTTADAEEESEENKSSRI